MPNIATTLWLGNQTSYDAISSIRAKAHEFKQELKADYEDGLSDQEASCTHPMLEVQGNVGIITVAGSLVSGRAGYMRYYGVTGYEDIANAFLAALQNGYVESIVMNMSSPGGDVAGCHETALFIDQIGKIKPVVTYASGVMASAGLWLGCTAKAVYCSATTIVGSLGVMRLHVDKTKMLKDVGYKVTIIRAGDKKNLVNPYEPLGKEALAHAEAQAGAVHEVFTAWVAGHRGVDVPTAEETFAQGQEFVGKWAVDSGLVDAIGTLETAVTKASALGAAKKSKASKVLAPQRAFNQAATTSNNKVVSAGTISASVAEGHNSAKTEGIPMPKPFTQEQLTAMAAGVALDIPENPAGDSENKASADAGNTASTAPDPKDAELASLKASVEAKDAELLTAKAETEALQAKLTEATEATVALKALSEIVRGAVVSMTVPLNGDTKAVATMTASQLVEAHAEVSKKFQASFKVGGVAMTSPKPAEAKPETKATSTISPLVARMAMLVPRI